MSRPSSPPLFARFEHVIVLAAYTLLTFAQSFPLITQLGTHIAGVEGDVWSYLWAMGWARIAVLNLGVNPFHTDFVYYPLGGATQLLWGTALPSFASIPLQLAFGLIPAFNLVYFAASILTAYGMYLLAKEIFRAFAPVTTHRQQIAAFFTGAAFTFSALRLGYGLAFTNLFHTEFIPFYVLFLLRVTKKSSRKNVALAGFFFALNAYIDFQIAAFLALLTALWMLFFTLQSWRNARRTSHKMELPLQAFRQWALMLGIAGVLVLPMLGVVLNDFAIEGGNYIRVFPLKYSADRSYDVLSFVLPNARSTFYQSVPAPRVENVNASVKTPDDSELSPDRQAFLGITVLVLAIVGALFHWRKFLFWILAGIFFAILSLGPVLHFAGVNTNLPLPFALVNAVPLLNNIRIPMRYGLMVVFAASILAGAGTYVLLQRRTWFVLPLLALLLMETAVLPYPTLAFRVPRVYEQIAQMPGDATVLEIPGFNWRYAAKNEAYQVIHQKRILRAYTNRIAPDLGEYFNLRQTPIVVRSLRILEGAEKGILTGEEIAQDRSVLNDTLAFFDLRYAVLHRDQLPAERVARIDAYLRDVLQARVLDDDGEVIAYELPQTSFDTNAGVRDLASNATLMYLGRGWQIEPLADSDDSQGRFLKPGASEIYLPQTDAAHMDLDLYSAQANAELRAQMNNENADTLTLQPGWQTSTLQTRFPNTLNVLRLFNPSGKESFAAGSIEIK